MTRRSCRILALLLAGEICVAQDSAGTRDWPQIKGNSGFTGLSGDDTVKPPLKLVWSYRLDGDASGDAGAGVIVAGGKVFVPVANSASMVVLDAATGRFLWERRDSAIASGGAAHKTAFSYDNGLVIFWRRRGASEVMALEAETGRVRWRQTLSPQGKDVSRGGLPVAGGIVYCGEGGAEPAITAFETKTGRRVWRTALGRDAGEYVIGPTVAGGRVFVATRANVRRSPEWRRLAKELRGAITALDAKTGKILWSRKNIYPWTPMASDGTVLACPMWSSADEKLYLLDCRTGETMWAKDKMGFHVGPPITLTRDLILYQPWGPRLQAFSRETGEAVWTFHNEFTSAGCCTPAVSGKFAYIGTSVPRRSGDLESLRGFRLADTPSETGKYGTMNAIDLSTGKSVWRFPTANTVCGDPAIAYGRLYFMSRDGRVYCCAPAGEGEPATPESPDRSPPAPEADVAELLSKPREPDASAGSSWPMQGGGPDRLGATRDGLEPPLDLAWKVDTGGRVLGSAAIADGIVYAASESGKIVAVEGEGGRKVWEFTAGGPIRCSPAVAGNVVYCGSDDGSMYALRARNGELVWKYRTGGPVQASPALAGDVIVFGASDHLYALNRRTGRKLWSFRTHGFCIQAPPVIHGDAVYAAQWADWVWRLDLKTGKPAWRSFIPVSIEAVSVHRDRLWARSPYWIVELDPHEGRWLRIAAASYGYGAMAFAGDRLF